MGKQLLAGCIELHSYGVHATDHCIGQSLLELVLVHVVPTQQLSTAYFIVGMPGHSWQHTAVGGTSIAYKSTIFASKTMAATTIDLLMKPDLIAAAKADWETRMEGLTYVSPLPPDLKPPLDQLPPHED